VNGLVVYPGNKDIYIGKKNGEPHAICAGPEWADGESSGVGFLSMYSEP
jgi:hypothetical protein